MLCAFALRSLCACDLPPLVDAWLGARPGDALAGTLVGHACRILRDFRHIGDDGTSFARHA
jgi:hypothetical protein